MKAVSRRNDDKKIDAGERNRTLSVVNVDQVERC